MPQTNIQTLNRLIQHSALLSEGRKEALLSVLPSFTNEQAAQLENILIAEGAMIQEVAASAIRKGVAEDNSNALEQLGQFLHDAERTLRKEHEKAEKAQEEQDIQSFFPDVA